MFALIGISSIAISLLIILGAPTALLVIRKLPQEFVGGAFYIALALLCGFAGIAFAATWSFGLLGLDYFGSICLFAFFFPLILLTIFKLKHGQFFKKLVWEKYDIGLLLLFPLSALMNRAHVDPILGLGFRSGDGPDVAQNMMSFVGLESRGQTWFTLRDTFLRDVDATSLYDGLEKIYTAYSFQAQAVYDYLLYGTRWGLSIPASYATEILGKENTLLFPALISTVGILALGIVTYGFLSILIKNLPLALCVSITLISSGALIYQTFNGGLAQAWALPGVGALSALLMLLFTKNQTRESLSKPIFIVITAVAWIGIAVPYFDAALVIAVLIVLVGIAELFFSKFKSSEILKQFSIAGLLAAILVLPFTCVAAYTLPIRLRLASGTGIDAPNWPLPSELLGFGNIWTGQRSSLATGISTIASSLIVIYFIRSLLSKRKDEVAIGQIGIALSLIVALSAIAARISVAGNNYIYMKVGAYLAPIGITVLYLVLTGKSIFNSGGLFRNLDSQERIIEKKRNIMSVVPIVPVLLTIIAVVSSQITINGIVPKGVYFPKDFGKISVDKAAQRDLTDYNYFLFYTPSSNIMGAFGDVIWISKAPNDLNLIPRNEREIRVLCYSFNKECTPPGSPISVPSLEKYGLLSFKTSISIDEYMALSIQNRYAEAFKQTGQDPVVIPERYLGGNPLLKP